MNLRAHIKNAAKWPDKSAFSCLLQRQGDVYFAHYEEHVWLGRSFDMNVIHMSVQWARTRCCTNTWQVVTPGITDSCSDAQPSCRVSVRHTVSRVVTRVESLCLSVSESLSLYNQCRVSPYLSLSVSISLSLYHSLTLMMNSQSVIKFENVEFTVCNKIRIKTPHLYLVYLCLCACFCLISTHTHTVPHTIGCFLKSEVDLAEARR